MQPTEKYRIIEASDLDVALKPAIEGSRARLGRSRCGATM
jgi:hypothetical protein